MILDSPPPLILDDEGMTVTHAFINIPTGVSRGSRDRGQRCREASSWARDRTRPGPRADAGRGGRRGGAAGDGRRAGGDRLRRACDRTSGSTSPTATRWSTSASPRRMSPGPLDRPVHPDDRDSVRAAWEARAPPGSTTATSTGCGWPTACTAGSGPRRCRCGTRAGTIVKWYGVLTPLEGPRRRGPRARPAKIDYYPLRDEATGQLRLVAVAAWASGPPTRRPSSTPAGCGTASPSSTTRSDRGDETAGGKARRGQHDVPALPSPMRAA